MASLWGLLALAQRHGRLWSAAAAASLVAGHVLGIASWLSVQGIVGVAWGMTIGYAAVAWLTGAAAWVPILGWRPWWAHQSRLARTLVGFGLDSVRSATCFSLPAFATVPPPLIAFPVEQVAVALNVAPTSLFAGIVVAAPVTMVVAV